MILPSSYSDTMGQRPAKSSDEKMGHDGPTAGNPDPMPSARPVDWRPAQWWWHEDAIAWYQSLPRSGQAPYYQQSDAEHAHASAHLLSSGLGQIKRWNKDRNEWEVWQREPDDGHFKAWASEAHRLLSTETARRASHIRLSIGAADNQLNRAVSQLITEMQSGAGPL